MKWLALVFVGVSTTAFAQADKDNLLLQRLKKDQQLKTSNRTYITPFVQQSHYEKMMGKADRPKMEFSEIVTALLQDGMPCIRPDMKKYKPILNAGDSSVLKHPIDPGIYVLRNRRPIIRPNDLGK